MANPSDEDHAAMREWASDFDPERFDRQAVNTALWWWAKARGRQALRASISIQKWSHPSCSGLPDTHKDERRQEPRRPGSSAVFH